jgi:hypothetical protein
MKKYFYSDGTNKFGPYTIEELKGMNITPHTLIWFQGLTDWRAANTFPELYEVYMPSTPPPVTITSSSFNEPRNNISQPYNVNNQQPPKTWLVESILATLFCCLPFGIVGIINASKVESRFNMGDFDGANKASAEAGKWTKLGFWIGIVFGVLYMILMAIGVASEF